MGEHSSILRILWAVIETAPSQDLLTLSDAALTAMLIQQVSRQLFLSREESVFLSNYVRAKRSLIRDTAAFRSTSAFYPQIG